MNLDLITSHLPEELQKKLTLFYRENSHSTMQDAKAISESPALILAPNQKAAHGRFARPFFTHKGGGIYLSLKLPLENDGLAAPQFTILTAVALCLAIEGISTKKPQIKWVNDLYLKGKKFAGILAEGTLDAEKQCLTEAIIGVGFNYNIPQTTFPIALQDKVTSLFQETPPVSKEIFVALFITYFFQLLKQDPKEVLVAYKSRSFVLGRHITFTSEGLDYSGEAIDIAPDGSLVVQLTSGEKRNLHSGEISLTSF